MTSTHRWYLPSMTTEGVKPFHDVRPHRWVSPYYDVISQIGVSPFTKRWRQDTTLQGYHPPLRPSLSKATPFLGQPSPRLPNRWSIRLLMSSAHREYPPLMASTHRGGASSPVPSSPQFAYLTHLAGGSWCHDFSNFYWWSCLDLLATHGWLSRQIHQRMETREPHRRVCCHQ